MIPFCCLKTKMILIGICGKLGSGKDYFVTNVVKKMYPNHIHVNFGDQIKINALVANPDVSFENVFVQKTKETRILLQKSGTENGRDIYGKDVWVKFFDNWVKLAKLRGVSCVVCSDVRFKNEFDYFKQNDGILVKMVSAEFNHARLLQESGGDPVVYDNIKNHASECDLDSLEDSMFNLVIENRIGALEEMTRLFKQLFPYDI